jgi:hypothetical protein
MTFRSGDRREVHEPYGESERSVTLPIQGVTPSAKYPTSNSGETDEDVDECEDGETHGVRRSL